MRLIIPGTPLPLLRPRIRRFGNQVSMYDPQANHKAKIAEQIKEQLPKDFVLSSSIVFCMEMRFYLPVPESLPKSKKNRLLWSFHDKKPDIDNLAKLIADSCNGTLYHDDSQIINLIASKQYSNNPRTEIDIMTKQPPQNTDNKIIEHFSPDELRHLRDMVFRFSIYHPFYGSDLPEDDSFQEPLFIHQAALFLSELADLYSSPLSKIKKDYPKYYQECKVTRNNNKERESDGKPLS